MLIHSHLHAFMSIPPMKTENVIELRKLRDTVYASLAALGNLGRPVIHWDDLLVYVISQKFSARTRSEWNLQCTKELPSYKDIHEFLTLRIRCLTDLSDSSKISDRFVNDKTRSSVNNVSALKCVYCRGNHIVLKCKDFLKKSATEHSSLARQLKLCFNCLKSGILHKNAPADFGAHTVVVCIIHYCIPRNFG